MSKYTVRTIVGLVLALVALTWGTSPVIRAAGTAGDFVAKAMTGTDTSALKAANAVIPSKPVTGTTVKEPEPAPPPVLASRSLAGVFMDDAAQGQGQAKGKATRDDVAAKFQKVSPSELKAAAKRAAAAGMKPGVAGRTDLIAAAVTPADLSSLEGPGGVPHYFGPYGNVAFSPLPTGGVATIEVTSPGTGYVSPVVTIGDVYGTGSGAAATATGANGVIYGFTILTPGSGYVAPLVTIEGDGDPAASATAIITAGAVTGFDITSGGSGYTTATVTIVDDNTFCGGAAQPDCGSGATASPLIGDGGIVDIMITDPGTGYTAPWVTITDSAGPGDGATGDAAIGGTLTGGLEKFVDGLPGLGTAGANSLGQYLPVAVPEAWPLGCDPEGTTVPCTADYYEVALVEYEEKMHSGLPLTRLRGYVQIVPEGWTGTDLLENVYTAVPLTTLNGLTQDIAIGGVQAYGAAKPHYLGPVIVAKGRVHGMGAAGEAVPVRVKFYNLLPTGSGGDLFLPVDETVPGSSYGPALPGTFNDKYTQNRMTPHLHGNNTVWLSDGNTHQWITPFGENTPYPAGASARNVPDMPGCAEDEFNSPLLPGRSGCMTFYYTNAQSARLQFYHDHAHGITRLNVYAGAAGGYLLTDAVEQDMINGTNDSGVNPDNLRVLPDIGIPLIIQDRTFVDADTIFAQDPTWNWGTTAKTNEKITAANTGDLWFPHVYMTVQNPWDLTGTNAVGKWHYGPWFNPPTPVCPGDGTGRAGCIEVGPVPNPYADPANEGYSPLEPPMIPGVPNPSSPGEAFLDTPLVNGTAYPYLEVPAAPVRFRILNAANDRFLNLQLYEAFSKENFHFGTGVQDPPTATQDCGGVGCTEVKMVPVSVNPANQFADTPSGIPDPDTAGPPWILIGTEGGFMPKPVVVPQQPIGWNLDMGYFAFGIVNQHSIFLGSAERADVIVDFSAYAGKTLILYNDSPAPVPAGAGVFDFYTGDGNQMDAGGAPNTLPGYGPNTRTIMQIRVGARATTAPDFSLANLQAVFAKTDTKRGVFEVSQDQIIIPQEAYNSAYNTTFPSSAAEQYLQIGDMAKTFRPLDAEGVQQDTAVTIPLEMKAMHDEMGGVYEIMYGRMSGMLGLVNPNSNVHLLIPYPYAGPPVDIVKGAFEATQIGSLADGTQIWRIFHNGVDTHPIHTHLFHTQIVNRVDQSGQFVGDPVDPIELGWKDTVRINPLEVTFLALRPTVPTPAQVPFEVPDSIRLIDPSLPEGATLPPPSPAGWFDPTGIQLEGAAIPVNHFVNFGWEYVWHCHILSHEEMDMMHALVFAVPPRPPTLVSAIWNGATGGNRRVTVTWTDNSIKEAGFRVERATDANFTLGLTSFNVAASTADVPSTVTYVDGSIANNTKYWYRVVAIGPTVGDTATPNFPTMSADSVSNTTDVTVGTAAGAAPSAPTNLTAAVQAGPQVNLTWTDTATNETGFVVERCTGVGCANFAQIGTAGPRTSGSSTVAYTDATVTAGNTYSYRVAAVNVAGPSAFSNIASASVVAIPVAPTTFTVANSPTPVNGPNTRVTLDWAHPGGTELSSFTIQRATNLDFTLGLSTSTVPGSTVTVTQTVRDNTTYYFRIRANNSLDGSSSWKNALPFPIRTGR